MKKLLGIALAVASMGFAAPATEAKAAAPSASATAAQWPRQRQRQRNNRRVYVTTQSRIVRVGRRVYRETYQVRRWPNGRTTTQLISRVRIR